VDKLVPMVSAATPVFAYEVEFYVTSAILLAMVIIEIVAFINCITQRADAFPVVGSLSKVAWLGILGGALLLTVLCARPNAISIFGFIAITAAAIYMLDVRPALRDATNGTGSW
jgi:hypothetical protein